MVNHDTLLIHPGGAEDLPDLLRGIEALALFEKAAAEVEVDLPRLRRDWEAGYFAFLVARRADQCLGIALYYPRYSTWKGLCFYLEDLYVWPEARSQGIGGALLQKLAALARESGAQRLDWQVLDWNSDAVAFYEKLGAKVEKEWWNCKWRLKD